MTLEDIINGANRFWQKVRGERLGIDPETVVMPKRKRPKCCVQKPYIHKGSHSDNWFCSCEMAAVGTDINIIIVGVGKTPMQAAADMHERIYRDLDKDLILSCCFLYIDEIIQFAPPGVFELLPQVIKDFYEPLESSRKPE